MHIAAFFACMRLGAPILPLDWRAARTEFDRVVALFAPKAILDDHQPPLDWSPLLVDIDQSAAVEPDMAPVADAPGGVMALTLTSGTTALPRAMVTTHDQTYARCMTRALEGMFTRDDRFLTTLPFAYLAGREHALNPLLLGATLVIFPTLFEPQELVDFVNSRAITAFNLSPNMSRAVLALGGAGGLLMPNVRTMISTTGKLDPHERRALRQHVVPQVIDYYGNSGAGPITVIGPDDDAGEPTAAGHCAIGMEIAVVDEGGQAVATGAIGRIRIRGRAVTTEMVGAVESADEGFRDGWYYPGDFGRFAAGGILHLTGRSADLIKRGGLMVHAQEVEQVLRRHPAIVDVAVVGVRSVALGQEVVAFVEIRAPIDQTEVIRFCRRDLAGFKVPSRIEVIDALPRNAAGKVTKGALLDPMPKR